MFFSVSHTPPPTFEPEKVSGIFHLSGIMEVADLREYFECPVCYCIPRDLPLFMCLFFILFSF